MNRVAGIRKFGFRRWYERQLIESHACLVTCLLCLILIAACAETLSFRGPVLQQLELYGLVAAGTLLGFAAWRRYHVLMVRAERAGEQSTCGKCQTYGRFSVVEPAQIDALESNRNPFRIEAGEQVQLKVRCKVCGHEWLIE